MTPLLLALSLAFAESAVEKALEEELREMFVWIFKKEGVAP